MSQSHNPADETSILLHSERGDGIIELTLNRPDAFNALSSDLMADLRSALRQAENDPKVRVIIISANGRGFSAGHDLREVQSLTTVEARKRLLDQCCELMMAIVACPKPVIAKVHGVASAAGCQLVASCDLAVAESGARFGTPGVNIGLFCHTPMVALSRNVHRKHAMETLLTGDLFNAERAMQIGLINRHTPAEELDGAVMELARKIASKSSYTLKIGKRAFYEQAEMPLAEAYAYATEVMVENLGANDAVEGIAAFIEKRNPQWQDK